MLPSTPGAKKAGSAHKSQLCDDDIIMKPLLLPAAALLIIFLLVLMDKVHGCHESYEASCPVIKDIQTNADPWVSLKQIVCQHSSASPPRPASPPEPDKAPAGPAVL